MEKKDNFERTLKRIRRFPLFSKASLKNNFLTQSQKGEVGLH